MKRTFVIAGSGQEEKRLRSIAGPTIKFLGRVPDGELTALYAQCRAFLFAADEDFGIAPVEAQSYGRPVIAYGHGGSLETVRVNDPLDASDTGVYFSEQTVDAVIDGIVRFESMEQKFVPVEIQNHARQFDTSIFVKKIEEFIKGVLPHSGAGV
jgi:glycosyltransferase involved in cell wall biosynthesis